MANQAYNPETDGAKMGFKDAMSYGDYLHLDQILAHQAPQSEAHDELLFVIQHQTSELWMKLILHELSAAREALISGDKSTMFKMLARVSRIFEQLNNQWDVLRTMTPADYTTFREALGPSSGFQSYQYRMIEFVLGNRNPNMLKPHEHVPDVHKALSAELARPSFYHEVVRHLYTTLDGHDQNVPELSLDAPHTAHPDIQARWKTVYENIDVYWSLYELGEKLVDLEDYFRRWRFNHVTTVERVIGFKRGTGGTSGVQYLRKMLSVELFPDLWHLRGDL
ncbi:Tryptophan 2,3-dioxygenase [Tritonibacter multivorans]|uniref:Tryptophan 2,3-dioxygenase n=1 Tax=Tritonibacter multivorans TaxID=928856 RepID=A0A0P1GDQ6_9RHOB|nr:tryptophan 2,3-dioxygenase family protein [Tritonibacter multivorans]MDA7422910.1 tryptophan 2,3-dioxygenase family protein [Tritonibacter multivorans]CUH74701.1 Tryptophan 2,3-dioxygenase [Tritonibacter multivorans]SFD76103.1 tryptophan 2,3-dioxygenase [Tritonibacter multivorans]